MKWPWWRRKAKLRAPEPDVPSAELHRLADERQEVMQALAKHPDYFAQAVDDALRRAR